MKSVIIFLIGLSLENLLVLFELIIAIPSIALIVSIFTFLAVFISFLGKPWKLKGWLLTSLFLFIIWSGLTILVRINNDAEITLWLLRISFIALQISFYSAYRFHTAMLVKPTDNRISTFGLAILIGLNIALSFNTDNLHIVKDSTNQYYTDLFGPILMITNIIMGTWSGYYVFKSLNEMDAFALFYGIEGRRNTIVIFIFGLLILFSIGALFLWLIRGGTTDSTPFIMIITIALVFLGFTYGINPTSKILAPQRIWGFLIVSDNGLPLFDYHFSKEESLGELALVAMAISASNTTIMINLKSKTSINEISMEDRTILVIKRESLLFCLVADHQSLQLNIEFLEIVNRIVEHNKFTIPGLNSSYGIFEYAVEILTEVFGTKSVDIPTRKVL